VFEDANLELDDVTYFSGEKPTIKPRQNEDTITQLDDGGREISIVPPPEGAAKRSGIVYEFENGADFNDLSVINIGAAVAGQNDSLTRDITIKVYDADGKIGTAVLNGVGNAKKFYTIPLDKMRPDLNLRKITKIDIWTDSLSGEEATEKMSVWLHRPKIADGAEIAPDTALSLEDVTLFKGADITTQAVGNVDELKKIWVGGTELKHSGEGQPGIVYKFGEAQNVSALEKLNLGLSSTEASKLEVILKDENGNEDYFTLTDVGSDLQVYSFPLVEMRDGVNLERITSVTIRAAEAQVHESGVITTWLNENGPPVELNGGEPYALTREINLKVTIDDLDLLPTKFRVSINGGDYTEWTDYDDESTITLTGKDGNKELVMQFIDEDGEVLGTVRKNIPFVEKPESVTVTPTPEEAVYRSNDELMEEAQRLIREYVGDEGMELEKGNYFNVPFADQNYLSWADQQSFFNVDQDMGDQDISAMGVPRYNYGGYVQFVHENQTFSLQVRGGNIFLTHVGSLSADGNTSANKYWYYDEKGKVTWKSEYNYTLGKEVETYYGYKYRPHYITSGASASFNSEGEVLYFDTWEGEVETNDEDEVISIDSISEAYNKEGVKSEGGYNRRQYEYDAAGRQTREAWSTYSSYDRTYEYTYPAGNYYSKYVGRYQGEYSSSGERVFEYDEAGKLIRDAQTNDYESSYDGQYTYTRGTGVARSYSYSGEYGGVQANERTLAYNDQGKLTQDQYMYSYRYTGRWNGGSAYSYSYNYGNVHNLEYDESGLNAVHEDWTYIRDNVEHRSVEIDREFNAAGNPVNEKTIQYAYWWTGTGTQKVSEQNIEWTYREDGTASTKEIAYTQYHWNSNAVAYTINIVEAFNEDGRLIASDRKKYNDVNKLLLETSKQYDPRFSRKEPQSGKQDNAYWYYWNSYNNYAYDVTDESQEHDYDYWWWYGSYDDGLIASDTKYYESPPEWEVYDYVRQHYTVSYEYDDAGHILERETKRELLRANGSVERRLIKRYVQRKTGYDYSIYNPNWRKQADLLAEELVEEFAENGNRTFREHKLHHHDEFDVLVKTDTVRQVGRETFFIVDVFQADAFGEFWRGDRTMTDEDGNILLEETRKAKYGGFYGYYMSEFSVNIHLPQVGEAMEITFTYDWDSNTSWWWGDMKTAMKGWFSNQEQVKYLIDETIETSYWSDSLAEKSTEDLLAMIKEKVSKHILITTFPLKTNASTATIEYTEGNQTKSKEVTLSDEGDNVFIIEGTDNNNKVVKAEVTIIKDSVPPAGAIVINNGNDYTQVKTVVVDLSEVQDATTKVTKYQVANADGTFGAWRDYPAGGKIELELTGADGAKTVSMRFQDEVGNVSKTIKDFITLDTQIPFGSVKINGGIEFHTTTETVTLNVEAQDLISGVKKIRARNVNADGSGDWKDVELTGNGQIKNWELIAGEGARTVEIEIEDNAEHKTIASNTITVDTKKPQASVVINGGGEFTTSADGKVNLKVGALDDTSGVKAIRIRNGSEDGSGVWQTVTPDASGAITGWPLLAGDGLRSVEIEVEDAAGHKTLESTKIKVDTTSPVGQFTINGGGLLTSDTKAEIDVSGISDGEFGSGVKSLTFSADGGATWTSVNYPIEKNKLSIDLPAGDGWKEVQIKFEDNLGHVSAVMEESVLLDTTGPTGSVILAGGAAFVNSVEGLTLDISELTDGTPSSGVAGVRVSTDGGNTFGDWIDVQDLNALQVDLPAGADGLRTITVEARDKLGNVSLKIEDTVTLDTTAPTGAIRLNAGATHTSERAVVLDVGDISDGAGSGLAMGFLYKVGNSDWITAQHSDLNNGLLTLNLPDQDGTHNIVVKQTDQLEHAASFSASITLDTTGPTGTISLADGRKYTDNKTVKLDLTKIVDEHLNVKQYQVALDGADYGAWQDMPVNGLLEVSFAAPDGQKNVTMKFRDDLRNVSAEINDSILLAADAKQQAEAIIQDHAAAIKMLEDLVSDKGDSVKAFSDAKKAYDSSFGDLAVGHPFTKVDLDHPDKATKVAEALSALKSEKAALEALVARANPTDAEYDSLYGHFETQISEVKESADALKAIIDDAAQKTKTYAKAQDAVDAYIADHNLTNKQATDRIAEYSTQIADLEAAIKLRNDAATAMTDSKDAFDVAFAKLPAGHDVFPPIFPSVMLSPPDPDVVLAELKAQKKALEDLLQNGTTAVELAKLKEHLEVNPDTVGAISGANAAKGRHDNRKTTYDAKLAEANAYKANFDKQVAAAVQRIDELDTEIKALEQLKADRAAALASFNEKLTNFETAWNALPAGHDLTDVRGDNPNPDQDLSLDKAIADMKAHKKKLEDLAAGVPDHEDLDGIADAVEVLFKNLKPTLNDIINRATDSAAVYKAGAEEAKAYIKRHADTTEAAEARIDTYKAALTILEAAIASRDATLGDHAEAQSAYQASYATLPDGHDLGDAVLWPLPATLDPAENTNAIVLQVKDELSKIEALLKDGLTASELDAMDTRLAVDIDVDKAASFAKKIEDAAKSNIEKYIAQKAAVDAYIQRHDDLNKDAQDRVAQYAVEIDLLSAAIAERNSSGDAMGVSRQTYEAAFAKLPKGHNIDRLIFPSVMLSGPDPDAVLAELIAEKKALDDLLKNRTSADDLNAIEKHLAKTSDYAGAKGGAENAKHRHDARKKTYDEKVSEINAYIERHARLTDAAKVRVGDYEDSIAALKAVLADRTVAFDSEGISKEAYQAAFLKLPADSGFTLLSLSHVKPSFEIEGTNVLEKLEEALADLKALTEGDVSAKALLAIETHLESDIDEQPSIEFMQTRQIDVSVDYKKQYDAAKEKIDAYIKRHADTTEAAGARIDAYKAAITILEAAIASRDTALGNHADAQSAYQAAFAKLPEGHDLGDVILHGLPASNNRLDDTNAILVQVKDELGKIEALLKDGLTATELDAMDTRLAVNIDADRAATFAKNVEDTAVSNIAKYNTQKAKVHAHIATHTNHLNKASAKLEQLDKDIAAIEAEIALREAESKKTEAAYEAYEAQIEAMPSGVVIPAKLAERAVADTSDAVLTELKARKAAIVALLDGGLRATEFSALIRHIGAESDVAGAISWAKASAEGWKEIAADYTTETSKLVKLAADFTKAKAEGVALSAKYAKDITALKVALALIEKTRGDKDTSVSTYKAARLKLPADSEIAELFEKLLAQSGEEADNPAKILEKIEAAKAAIDKLLGSPMDREDVNALMGHNMQMIDVSRALAAAEARSNHYVSETERFDAGTKVITDYIADHDLTKQKAEAKVAALEAAEQVLLAAIAKRDPAKAGHATAQAQYEAVYATLPNDHDQGVKTLWPLPASINTADDTDAILAQTRAELGKVKVLLKDGLTADDLVKMKALLAVVIDVDRAVKFAEVIEAAAIAGKIEYEKQTESAQNYINEHDRLNKAARDRLAQLAIEIRDLKAAIADRDKAAEDMIAAEQTHEAARQGLPDGSGIEVPVFPSVSTTGPDPDTVLAALLAAKKALDDVLKGGTSADELKLVAKMLTNKPDMAGAISGATAAKGRHEAKTAIYKSVTTEIKTYIARHARLIDEAKARMVKYAVSIAAIKPVLDTREAVFGDEGVSKEAYLAVYDKLPDDSGISKLDLPHVKPSPEIEGANVLKKLEEALALLQKLTEGNVDLRDLNAIESHLESDVDEGASIQFMQIQQIEPSIAHKVQYDAGKQQVEKYLAEHKAASDIASSLINRYATAIRVLMTAIEGRENSKAHDLETRAAYWAVFDTLPEEHGFEKEIRPLPASIHPEDDTDAVLKQIIEEHAALVALVAGGIAATEIPGILKHNEVQIDEARAEAFAVKVEEEANKNVLWYEGMIAEMEVYKDRHAAGLTRVADRIAHYAAAISSLEGAVNVRDTSKEAHAAAQAAYLAAYLLLPNDDHDLGGRNLHELPFSLDREENTDEILRLIRADKAALEKMLDGGVTADELAEIETLLGKEYKVDKAVNFSDQVKQAADTGTLVYKEQTKEVLNYIGEHDMLVAEASQKLADHAAAASALEAIIKARDLDVKKGREAEAVYLALIDQIPSGLVYDKMNVLFTRDDAEAMLIALESEMAVIDALLAGGLKADEFGLLKEHLDKKLDVQTAKDTANATALNARDNQTALDEERVNLKKLIDDFNKYTASAEQLLSNYSKAIADLKAAIAATSKAANDKVAAKTAYDAVLLLLPEGHNVDLVLEPLLAQIDDPADNPSAVLALIEAEKAAIEALVNNPMNRGDVDALILHTMKIIEVPRALKKADERRLWHAGFEAQYIATKKVAEEYLVTHKALLEAGKELSDYYAAAIKLLTVESVVRDSAFEADRVARGAYLAALATLPDGHGFSGEIKPIPEALPGTTFDVVHILNKIIDLKDKLDLILESGLEADEFGQIKNLIDGVVLTGDAETMLTTQKKVAGENVTFYETMIGEMVAYKERHRRGLFAVANRIAEYAEDISAIESLLSQKADAVQDFDDGLAQYNDLFSKLPAGHPYEALALDHPDLPTSAQVALEKLKREKQELELLTLPVVTREKLTLIEERLKVIIPEVELSINELTTQITDVIEKAKQLQKETVAITAYIIRVTRAILEVIAPEMTDQARITIQYQVGDLIRGLENKEFDVSLSEGLNTIRVVDEDDQGNVVTKDIVIILDTTNPVFKTFEINNGDSYTLIRGVTLEVDAVDNESGIAQVLVGQDGGQKQQIELSDLEDHRVQIQLEGRNGVKTIELEVIDKLGHKTKISKEIIFDDVKPVANEFSINAGATHSRKRVIDLKIDASDATSGVSQIRARQTGGEWEVIDPAQLKADNGLHAFALTGVNGVKTIELEVTDAAGLKSVSAASIIFDDVRPSIDKFEINDGRSHSREADVTLSIAASDLTSGVASARVRNEGGVWQVVDLEALKTANGAWPFKLSGTDGLKTVEIEVTDQAGWKQTTQQTITLDRAAPTIADISFPAETNQSTVTIKYTLTDNVDQDADRAQTFELKEGLNTITLEDRDISGHLVQKTITILRDSTPPVIEVLSAPDVTRSGTIDIVYRADGVTMVQHVILKEGENRVTIEAEDALGNTAQETFTVIRDSIPPKVTILSAPPVTRARTATITYSSNEHLNADGTPIVYSLRVKLNGGANIITVNSPPDQAGNIGAATVSIIRDEAPLVRNPSFLGSAPTLPVTRGDAIVVTSSAGKKEVFFELRAVGPARELTVKGLEIGINGPGSENITEIAITPFSQKESAGDYERRAKTHQLSVFRFFEDNPDFEGDIDQLTFDIDRSGDESGPETSEYTINIKNNDGELISQYGVTNQVETEGGNSFFEISDSLAEEMHKFGYIWDPMRGYTMVYEFVGDQLICHDLEQCHEMVNTLQSGTPAENQKNRKEQYRQVKLLQDDDEDEDPDFKQDDDGKAPDSNVITTFVSHG